MFRKSVVSQLLSDQYTYTAPESVAVPLSVVSESSEITPVALLDSYGAPTTKVLPSELKAKEVLEVLGAPPKWTGNQFLKLLRDNIPSIKNNRVQPS